MRECKGIYCKNIYRGNRLHEIALMKLQYRLPRTAECICARSRLIVHVARPSRSNFVLLLYCSRGHLDALADVYDIGSVYGGTAALEIANSMRHNSCMQ